MILTAASMGEGNDEEAYPELGALDGLLQDYRDAGLEVSHLPVADLRFQFMIEHVDETLRNFAIEQKEIHQRLLQTSTKICKVCE
jgi:hypothetical protein